MSNVSSDSELVTKQYLAEFYQKILPYLSADTPDFDDLLNRPTKEVTSIASIMTPPPIANHRLTGSVGFTPVGTIISYYGETAPNNYLICDGSVYDKADYPELWQHLSKLSDTTPYIISDDDTKFKVPDLRGEFLRGTGTNSHTDQGNGANVGIHQDATEMPYIWLFNRGTLVWETKNETQCQPANIDYGFKNSPRRSGQVGSAYSGNESYGVTYKYSARPTNTSVLYCIATKNIYIDAGCDYSLDEKVVGTWIDGKPLYQKTYIGTTGPSASSTFLVDSNFTYLNGFEMVKAFGTCGYKYNGYDGTRVFIPWFISTSNYACINEYVDGLVLAYSAVFINSPYTLIVQYTKTTD